MVDIIPIWAQRAEAGDLEGALIEFLRDHSLATFNEIGIHFEPYIEVYGNYALVDKNTHLPLIIGISEKLADLALKLLNDKKIWAYDPRSGKRKRLLGMYLDPRERIPGISKIKNEIVKKKVF